MATIKVSATTMKKIEDYIHKKYENKEIKLTKNQVIDRVINLYHNLIDDSMINSIKNDN